MLTGPDLFAAVRASAAAASFRWLGQHTFLLRLGGRVLLVDPFLSEVEGRRVPPLFEPADAAGVVDAVLVTHDHLDHLDPAAVRGLAAETDARFVAPRAHGATMHALGVTDARLTLLDDGEEADLGGVRVHAIKAAHEFFDVTEDGHHPYLGYVLQGGGRTVYHAGDTVRWEGLERRLARWTLDVAFVPINGRDARRYRDDVQGNMTFQEAADLVGAAGVRLAVPAHHDMFAENSEDASRFTEYVAAKWPTVRTWSGGYTDEVPL